MINSKQGGNTNTILIVIVLIILVILGVWWFTMKSAPVDDGAGLNIDVNLPTDGADAAGGTLPAGDTTTPLENGGAAQ